jgi:hypothetical protein
VDCDDDYDDDDDEECLVVLFRSPIASESGASAGRGGGGNAGNLTVSSVFGDGNAGDDGRHRPDKRDDDDPRWRRRRSDDDDIRRRRHYRGLSFLPDGPVHLPLPSGGGGVCNLRVLHAPSGLLVAATGFAPDADHVLGVAAGRVLSRISVFDAACAGGGKSVDPHRLVREDLSAMMIDAAMSDGGRPLGLQLLVVGTSALSSSSRRRRTTTTTTTTEEEDELLSLELYTVDPSGGWRSCAGSGTAVGRGAEGVRSSLLRRRRRRRREGEKTMRDLEGAGGGGSSSGATSNDDAPPLRGWRGALDRAMMASVVAFDDRDDGGSPGDDDEDARGGGGGGARANHGAVVVFGAPLAGGARDAIGASRCATVGPAITEECYDRCRRRLADRKKLAGIT